MTGLQIVWPVHCTVYNVHATRFTVHCTLYTVHYSLYTVQTVLCNMQWTSFIHLLFRLTMRIYVTSNVSYALYNVHCTLYSAQCTLYSVQFTVYSVRCIVYSVQCNIVYNTLLVSWGTRRRKLILINSTLLHITFEHVMLAKYGTYFVRDLEYGVQCMVYTVYFEIT